MKKLTILFVAVIATLSTYAQMRVYVDQNSKSAYVLTDEKVDKVTFLSNGSPVITFIEPNRLAPVLPIRVFKDIVWTNENYSPYDKFQYTFTYGDKVQRYNFWEISVLVEWSKNGIKYDSTFMPCCPSNIHYITHDDISTAKLRDSLEARAQNLRANLLRFGIDLKWHGYHGQYFELSKGEDSAKKELKFYVSNDMKFSTNDSVITITALPYKNSCKNYQLENKDLNLTVNNEWPKGEGFRVMENYFIIKIRKNGKGTLETFLVNGNKEGAYGFF